MMILCFMSLALFMLCGDLSLCCLFVTVIFDMGICCHIICSDRDYIWSPVSSSGFNVFEHLLIPACKCSIQNIWFLFLTITTYLKINQYGQICWCVGDHAAEDGRTTNSRNTIYSKCILYSERVQQGVTNPRCRWSWDPGYSLWHLVFIFSLIFFLVITIHEAHKPHVACISHSIFEITVKLEAVYAKCGGVWV